MAVFFWLLVLDCGGFLNLLISDPVRSSNLLPLDTIYIDLADLEINDQSIVCEVDAFGKLGFDGLVEYVVGDVGEVCLLGADTLGNLGRLVDGEVCRMRSES